MQLCEYPFREGFRNGFEVYLREPGEHAIITSSRQTGSDTVKPMIYTDNGYGVNL